MGKEVGTGSLPEGAHTHTQSLGMRDGKSLEKIEGDKLGVFDGALEGSSEGAREGVAEGALDLKEGVDEGYVVGTPLGIVDGGAVQAKRGFNSVHPTPNRTFAPTCLFPAQAQFPSEPP